jgi:glycerol-3-phosphate acyltransferase PlsX
VALKTGEGAARYITEELRSALTSSLAAKVAALLARPALRRFKARITPTPAAPLLGLNGLVLKCHGSADAKDFGRSVGLAVDLAGSDLMSQIQRNMSRLVDGPLGDPA